ncbi:aldo/keto reductase [Nocardia brasiliensis]|uniref:aldo/keto reductase n=1 Tax=Nocardia brasiliensis TaxID=37326 RepID=UPI002455F071|nr:aldo/keto reductase [Nocardia brasiliensis]
MRRRALTSGGPLVSVQGLGTSTWGTKTDCAEAAKQLDIYVRAGGNLLDCANIYGAGRAEEFVGKLVGTVVPRAEMVLTSKAGGVLSGPKPRPDLSATHLLSSLDHSLRRMRTDYLDLWQLHTWDPDVPIEETLSAVDRAVSSGRVRFAGVSNYSSVQLHTAAQRQANNGVAQLASIQVEYSLLQRRIERRVQSTAITHGIAILPWAPLGRGVLSGKYRQGVPERRRASTEFQRYVGRYLDDGSTRIVDQVASVATELGVSPVAVALAWVRERPGVVAPLVGARTAAQLAESLTPQAVQLSLEPDVQAMLDTVSAPVEV